MIRLVIVAAAAIGLILFVAFIVSRLVQSRARGLSIRMQVFIALALIVGTFAFGLGLMVIDRVEARAVRLATQAAEDEAAALAGMIQGELERTGGEIGGVAKRLESERAQGAYLRMELIDPSGTVLFPAGARSALDRPGIVHVDAPVVVRGRTVGAVRVIKETVVMRRLLTDFAPTVLVISLVLGAAAGLAAMWIGRAIARPIEALSAFSESVSNGERAAPPAVTSGREVRRLAQSIDSMRRQLQGRPFVETFAADLSHELKNPVAAIRASAEVLEEGAIDEPEEARRFVGRIHEAAARIERLLGDLLSLARIEARGVEEFDPVDVGEVIETTLEAIEEGGARIDFERDGDTRVRGDATWLGRAVGNLVENGLVHSPSDARIELSVRRAEGNVVVSVKNPGSIPRHLQRKMFRRFVTTREDRGGTGLGLAIVRAVAEAHAGRAELSEPGPPTVEFRLVLPPARRGAAAQLLEAVDEVRASSPSASEGPLAPPKPADAPLE